MGEDDELGPQEDVPSPEGDPQLPNTQSTVLNSSADHLQFCKIANWINWLAKRAIR
jgi:hypothetical protein